MARRSILMTYVSRIERAAGQSFGHLVLAFALVVMASGCSGAAPSGASSAPTPVESATPSDLASAIGRVRWVAYAPTHYDPGAKPPVMPSEDSLRADLAVLREAGFDGLVTYGAGFSSLPSMARKAGFRGMLVGVWDPTDVQERQAAVEAAKQEIVIGIVVGNEGLTFDRYDPPTLERSLSEIKAATHKPVATSETVDEYLTGADASKLLTLGDFLAPTVHPYHHGVKEPSAAVAWTKQMYDTLVSNAGGKYVFLKEVGLPTAGDSGVSEERQAEYYRRLSELELDFAYFEAFDGPWKQWGATEPHWGLFRADRSPKLAGAADRLSGEVLDLADAYCPSGWMGDGEAGPPGVEVNPACQDHPHTPPTCYRWSYRGRGAYGWAAVAWQYPENNWGERPGKDLTRGHYRRVTFWARGAAGGERLIFKAGGHTKPGAPYPASFGPVETAVKLSKDWQRYELDIAGADLSNVPAGFIWAASTIGNPQGCVFYLDDIRYEP